jgi:hypothetical protein
MVKYIIILLPIGRLHSSAPGVFPRGDYPQPRLFKPQRSQNRIIGF